MDAFPGIAGGGINMTQQYSNVIIGEDDPSSVKISPVMGIFATKDETAAMRRDIERQFNRKEFLDLIQDHKSNWIPESKGGEPNHN